MVEDLRYSFRQLGRNPAFAVFVILTLAVGIGANTTIFGAVNAFLLRPFPYAAADRLVGISAAYTGRGDDWSVSLPNALDWGRRSRALEGFGYYQGGSVTLAGNDRPERLETLRASASLLPLLGAAPTVGRAFTADEDHPQGERVVVLSHALWQRRFAGDRAVIGQTVQLSGNPYTIIGVLPAGFGFPHGNVQAYLPLRHNETTWNRASGGLQVLARVRSGVSIEQAQADLNSVSAVLAREYPSTNEELTARVRTLRQALFGNDQVPLIMYTLLAAVGFVLLIACVNVANLLLARATRREREMAVRTAIGASRARVLRQLLTESITLAFLGGVAGCILSLWGSRLLASAIPKDTAIPRDFSIDGRVLLFTLALTVLTGVIFGLAPALHAARTDLTSLMGSRSAAGTRQHRRRRAVLVVAQVALAAVLLVSAGLTIRSLTTLLRTDPGFDARNLLTMRVTLDAIYREPLQTLGFQQRVLEQLRALPGVEGVGAVDFLPLSGTSNFNDFTFEDRPSDKRENAGSVIASPGYLEAMGIQLVRGRTLQAQDVRGAPGVIVVNRAFAQRYWGSSDPIGKRVLISFDTRERYWRTVVGVVGDVRHGGLHMEHRAETYVPYAQLPWAANIMTFVVRTRMDPLTLVNPVQNAIWSVDRNQAIYELRTMQRVVGDSQSVVIARMLAGALGIFGLMALLLAALGLYGVISFGVAQRTYEIGVRSALGATRADVLKLVLGQGLSLVIVGLGFGLLGAFAVTRTMSSMLHGVAARDPLTFAQTSLLLVAVAVLATLVPARRAARIDPAIALRSE
jgi:predicted permease